MKALLIDDQNHVKILDELNPTDRLDVVDYFIPCGGCGEAVLAEYTSDCYCHKCTRLSRNLIEEKGWAWEHPGYFQKNFGDRITVIAGTSEYRFDFTFCSADHDLGWGPDWDIEVDEWPKRYVELIERGCFTSEEMEELEMVYEYLYADKKKDEVFRKGTWEIEGGSLMEPDGLYIHNLERETEPMHITKQMLFGVDCPEDITQEQHNKFAELHGILLEWLVKNVG
jgi:hypothetical protein